MPFGIIGRTGPGMRQIVGFGNLSTKRGTFGGAFGARHCNKWGLYGVRVQQHRDAALFPNYCGQTCYCLVDGLKLYSSKTCITLCFRLCVCSSANHCALLPLTVRILSERIRGIRIMSIGFEYYIRIRIFQYSNTVVVMTSVDVHRFTCTCRSGG